MPPSGQARDTDFERQADALIRRLESLSERVMGAHGDPPSPLVAEMLEELSAAVEELEVSTEEIHGQNEALAEAKKQLDLESARYRDFFDLAPDGYLVTDTGGVILESNRAASDMLGTRSTSSTRSRWWSSWTPPTGASCSTICTTPSPATTGRLSNSRPGSPRPTTTPSPASVHLTVGGASGAAEPAGPRVRWLVRDVRRRMEAERDLAASETRYRLIAESAADVVIATDGASCVTFERPRPSGRSSPSTRRTSRSRTAARLTMIPSTRTTSASRRSPTCSSHGWAGPSRPRSSCNSKRTRKPEPT